MFLIYRYKMNAINIAHSWWIVSTQCFSVKHIQPIIKQQLSSFQIYIFNYVQGRRIHQIPQFPFELVKVNTFADFKISYLFSNL